MAEQITRRDFIRVSAAAEAMPIRRCLARPRYSVPMRTAVALAGVVLLSSALTFARQPALGSVSFENSGAPAAQESFLAGLAQLHNFEYAAAAELFRRAQQIDPGFAMAYWGEAMTYNHPVWMEQDRGAARRALARLAPTREARVARRQDGAGTGLPARRRNPLRRRRQAGARPRVRRRDGGAPSRLSGRSGRCRVLRAGAARHGARRPRLHDLHARRGGRRAGVSRSPESSGRGALSDSLLRRSGSRAARPARGARVFEDRAVRRSRAAHDLAHLRRPRDVGRRRDARTKRRSRSSMPGAPSAGSALARAGTTTSGSSTATCSSGRFDAARTLVCEAAMTPPAACRRMPRAGRTSDAGPRQQAGRLVCRDATALPPRHGGLDEATWSAWTVDAGTQQRTASRSNSGPATLRRAADGATRPSRALERLRRAREALDGRASARPTRNTTPALAREWARILETQLAAVTNGLAEIDRDASGDCDRGREAADRVRSAGGRQAVARAAGRSAAGRQSPARGAGGVREGAGSRAGTDGEPRRPDAGGGEAR